MRARRLQPRKTPGPLALNRRDLLKLLGGGILILVYPPEAAAGQYQIPDAYLQIKDDGTVALFTGKVEYGQGIMTSLAQMAAEELDLPLQSLRVVLGDTSLCPQDADGGTWGSLTTRNFGPPLRSAAAKAKAILIALAAQQLNLASSQLMTQDGFVISRTDSAVRVSYASLAGGKSIVQTLQTTPATKNFAQFTLSGQPARRLDAIDKVTGKALYTADIRLPGMLYAYILRPPAYGATLKSVDTLAAGTVVGTRVMQVNGQWVVLHAQPDQARLALELIKATAVYNPPPAGQDQETIYAYLTSRYTAGTLFAQSGNLATGQSQAVAKLGQTYYTPYLAHAPMEPHAAVVSIEGTKATVWASTQTPFTVRSDVAGALGFSTANVRVITPYIGGGFGGKSVNLQTVEAARIAKAAGQPVNLAWTREEEFFYDAFQPPSIIKTSSGLDRNNKISFWDSQVYCVGNRGAEMLYEVPHYRIQTYGNTSSQGSHPFSIGPWRAPGSNANTFARESHIDELAAAAGLDACSFRLLHLQTSASARLRKVLQTAAASFGWQPAKSPSGRGYGVACGSDAGAYVVMMASVEVEAKTGAIKVLRMLCAQDMGQVINPDGARMQMEGSMMMGLGYALSEELHFKNGAIQDLNFDSYAIPRFAWMPKLETVLVENNALSPQGGGEPSIITTGAVLANAVFDAIGVRVNRLPMTPARVLPLIQALPLALKPPQYSANQIQLTWRGQSGVKLQSSPSLTNPVWQEVPNTDGQSGLTLPATNGAAFFRLAR